MMKNRFALLTLVLLGLWALLPSATSADSCDRLTPSLSPEWAVDGAFETPQVLLLADPWDREVIRYDLTARAGGQVRGHLAKTLSDLGPVSIQPRGRGFTVRLETERLLFLDPWMRPEEVRDVKREGAFEGFGPWTFDVVGDSAIVCDDLKQDGDWVTGFFEFPLRDPARYRVLRRFQEEAAEQLYCKALGPYGARAGDGDYVLIVEERPRIYEVLSPAAMKRAGTDDLLVPLEAFPEGFTQRPELRDTTLKEYGMIMDALQFSSVPVAMYGQGAHLYVVTRSSLGGGAVEWKITKIDPDKDRVVGSAVLPTTRPHVVPVPGPAKWAFLEKGPAISWDEPHPVESILLIPTRKIQTIGAGPGSDLCD